MLFFLLILIVLGIGYWLFFSTYSQVFGKYPYKAHTSKKVVALTFDDGPNEPYTSQIVDFLNSKNIKATFFQVGDCVKRYPNVSKNIITSGHVIGNHSMSHLFRNYFKIALLKNEITSNQLIIQKYTGKTPALFRFPWLFRQPWLLQFLKENNLHPISGVFCHAFEVFQIDAHRIARRAIAKARPGAIIIFHDGKEGRGGNRQQTVEAVKITVEELSQRGYTFVTVDKLLGLPAYK